MDLSGKFICNLLQFNSFLSFPCPRNIISKQSLSAPFLINHSGFVAFPITVQEVSTAAFFMLTASVTKGAERSTLEAACNSLRGRCVQNPRGVTPCIQDFAE